MPFTIKTVSSAVLFSCNLSKSCPSPSVCSPAAKTFILKSNELCFGSNEAISIPFYEINYNRLLYNKKNDAVRTLRVNSLFSEIPY